MENKDEKPGPLSGYKILDLTTVVLGPYCTQLLGDLGADIIKVESPEGDIMRHAGPHVSEGMGPIYLTINRNKRAMKLDLKTAGAKEILNRLVRESDGFVHNIRAAGMKRLGFDYESVKALKPDIVYCHAVGYGSGGHYAGRQAYDDLVQAASGASFMIPMQDGSTEPRYFPGLVADKTTGLHAAYAMLAGFLHRERTGKGQMIEVPMMECMVSFTMVENLYGHAFVPPQEPIAYTRSINPNRKPYRTKDGYIAIMPYSNDNWRNFFTLGGMPDLIDDPRYSTYKERTKNITDLYKQMEIIALQRTTDEWMEVLGEKNVPCMRVHSLDSVLTDPQLRETGFLEEREHPTEGQYISINNPVKFHGSPTRTFREPPLQGQDNFALLEELGYSAEEVGEFEKEGTFGP
ncbi:MAG: CoA transferase [Pseudomonadota bacterium]